LTDKKNQLNSIKYRIHGYQKKIPKNWK